MAWGAVPTSSTSRKQAKKRYRGRCRTGASRRRAASGWGRRRACAMWIRDVMMRRRATKNQNHRQMAPVRRTPNDAVCLNTLCQSTVSDPTPLTPGSELATGNGQTTGRRFLYATDLPHRCTSSAAQSDVPRYLPVRPGQLTLHPGFPDWPPRFHDHVFRVPARP